MPTERIINSNQLSVTSTQVNENQILTENGFYWREKDGVKVLICRALEEKGFVNGFSTRSGGVSSIPENALNLSGHDIDTPENVTENRKRFLQIFDEDFQLATAWQIHSDKIKIVKNESDIHETNEQFDALTSNLNNLLAAVKTADCVPVLIGDAKTKAYAAIHAGWRGTVQSIVPKAINVMKENFGTRAEDLTVAVGAAALNCCYEIGQDVLDSFKENFPSNYEHLFSVTRENHAFVNLHQANREQLLNAGVQPENIYIAPFCTMERTDLFFSYRVEKKLYGKTGRLLSVIGRS